MKNKIMVFSVFLSSILTVSYGIAADTPESDSCAEDSAGPGDVEQVIYRAEKFSKKGEFGHVVRVLSYDADPEALPREESKQAYELKEANKFVHRKNTIKDSLALIAQSFFRGDYELTKEYFTGMPAHVRAQLPSIYVAMENMLKLSSHDCFQPEDFKPKFEELFSLIKAGNWPAVASLSIRLKISYEKEWPVSFRKVALMAIEEHARHEVTRARNKAQLIATYGRSAKENAVPTTTEKSGVLILSNSSLKSKVPTEALIDTANTWANQ